MTAEPVPNGKGGGRRGRRNVEASQLRLMAKVARMYHERGLRQPKIAEDLGISQPRVSRLLKQAVDMGIVRTVVTLPADTHIDLEDELQARYGLRDVLVVDVDGASGDVVRALGAAAASYFDVTLKEGDVIGVSSWSSTLLSAVDVMQPRNTAVAAQVVQILGGIGNPEVQYQATRLTGRLAELTGAAPMFVPTPGLVSSPAVRRALVKDTGLAEVTARWDALTVALVGIGSLAPSPLLRQSGNVLAEEEQEELRTLGAVGDVCLRFFDAAGEHVPSHLDERVIGITPAQLRRVHRRIGVAGGLSKFTAIRAALLGGWINILVTDLDVATRLLEEAT